MPSATLYLALVAVLFISPVLSQPAQMHKHMHPKRWDILQKPRAIFPNAEFNEDLQSSSSPDFVKTRSALKKRVALPATYDLDANGVPDHCDSVAGNKAECLQANGQWTTISATSQPTPTANILPAVTTASTANSARGLLPAASVFAKQNGTRDASGKGWSITKKGVLSFTGILGTKNLQGDKGRTGSIGGKIIWNFGDMTCPPDYKACGFDMGPAMYADPYNILSVDTKGISNIHEAAFIQPHQSNSFYTNEVLGNACTDWGMDNSNVAAINSTHGIVYSWQVWRGCPTPDGRNNGYQSRGVTASAITLGDKFPIADRVSGILTGPDAVAVGLIGTLSHEGYIYSYAMETSNNPTPGGIPIHNVIIGRALATDPNIFSSSTAHEFFSPSKNTWIRGIPLKSQAPEYNLVTSQTGGWTCDVYGSIMFNTFLNKYMLFCDAWMSEFLFYTADRPEGPWSEMYTILKGMGGYYGAHVHPEFSQGAHDRLILSMGPNRQFDVWEWDISAYTT